MKKVRHFKNLQALINRHPNWRIYHRSIGTVMAHAASAYAPAHDRPVTVEYNAEREHWEVLTW